MMMPQQKPERKFSASKPLIMGLITLAVLVGGFGTWSVMANISGAIIASGLIEVDQNRQVVQHPDGGVVQEILVEEGDLVSQDQTLIKLDPTLLSSELSVVESQLFELMARRGRLIAERNAESSFSFDPLLLERAAIDPTVQELVEGQEQLFVARNTSLAQEIETLEKQNEQLATLIKGVEAQIVAASTQIELVEIELKNQQKLLDRGLAQQAQVLALQRAIAQQQGSLGNLKAQKAQAEGQISEVSLQILQLQTTRREAAISELRDQQVRELELSAQRRALLEQLSRLDIKAPVSGIVYGLTIYGERAVIRPADPALYIVPQDRPLIIAARVEPINIDQLYIDQEVTLRFSALDQRTTPELFGHVTQVSADAFTDQATNMAYYRAEIQLNDGEKQRLPEGTTLIPGMPVEAFIRTLDRSPMGYLTKPLTDYFAKAFREG